MAEEKRCWLYTRIDAPEDAHGRLKAQEKELLDFAAREGYEVAGTASDLGSGLDMERPGLARVMQAVNEKDFCILLVKGIDRLGRDVDISFFDGAADQRNQCPFPPRWEAGHQR